MLAERANGTGVDASDGDAQNQNNDILGHSFGERVLILYNHRQVCQRCVHILTNWGKCQRNVWEITVNIEAQIELKHFSSCFMNPVDKKKKAQYITLLYDHWCIDSA